MHSYSIVGKNGKLELETLTKDELTVNTAVATTGGVLAGAGAAMLLLGKGSQLGGWGLAAVGLGLFIWSRDIARNVVDTGGTGGT